MSNTISPALLDALKKLNKTSVENSNRREEIQSNLTNEFERNLAAIISDITPIPANTKKICLEIKDLFIDDNTKTLRAMLTVKLTGGSFDYSDSITCSILTLDEISIVTAKVDDLEYGLPHKYLESNTSSLFSDYGYQYLFILYSNDDLVEYFSLSTVIGSLERCYDLSEISNDE